MKSMIFLLFIFLLINFSLQTAEDDIVKTLPEYSYKGRLYSGYLEAGPVKQFHYMFNLAHEDPEHKPLVLWFNGGPGCSSLDGWSSEHGPMQMDDFGNFTINDYSWHRAANMLYIESPGGVGFSYIDSKLDYDLEIDDEIAAKDNLNALLSFFKKFPSYKGRDFYISGESYAGIYVPTLAYEVLQYNKGVVESNKINLKGILVGNGVADWNYDTTVAMIDFAFTHHLTSYETRLEFNKYCIMDYQETKCDEIVEEINDLLDGINIYDYLRKCEMPTTEEGEIDYYSSYFLKCPWAFPNLAKKQKLMKSKPKSRTSKRKLYTEEEKKKLKLSPPCISDEGMMNYFNRDDVKAALHVKMDKEWELCSLEINQRYKRLTKGSIWTYPTLIKSGLRILIFSGDTDMAVPFNGNQLWIRDLKLEIEKPWRQWRAYDDPDNVSGYVINYKGLTFCTIKGTGHMAPQWKPKESFYMFSKFLNDESF
jgi:carboxypeptidase C (cathepsin A)